MDSIKTWARNLPSSPLGGLYGWHAGRHRPLQGRAFEELTLGELLRSYYAWAAFELESVRGQLKEEDEVSPALVERADDLEAILGCPGAEFRDLDEEESHQAFDKVYRTGDPVVDKWERQFADGKMPE